MTISAQLSLARLVVLMWPLWTGPLIAVPVSARGAVYDTGRLEPSAVHRQPARDADHLAGDESSIIACQERDNPRQIVGLAETLERDRPPQAFVDARRLFAFTGHRRQQRRF